MTTQVLEFLAEWAVRSSILILGAALLVWLLRVKDPSIRLAAWMAMLCGSLAIPLLTAALPRMRLSILRSPAVERVETPAGILADNLVPAVPAPTPMPAHRFDWRVAAPLGYAAIALLLLVRTAVGLLISRRLLAASRSTGRNTEGIEICESERVASPITLGIVRRAVVLPAGWREWDGRKLDAVLAHECAHVRRFDPAVQLLSAIHRAILWYSPLSWVVHSRIVRLAEEASDDAAVAVTRDRVWYAEVLLDFLRGPVGVAMARYGRAHDRIQRILDGTVLSRGVTRWSVAAILAIGFPLAYLAAAADPQSAPQPPNSPPKQAAAAAPIQPPAPVAAQSTRAANYLAGIGTVTPVATVLVKPRIDGLLKSVDFKEGETVQAGQLLATLDPGGNELPLIQAQSQLDQEQAALRNAQLEYDRRKRLVDLGTLNSEELSDSTALVTELKAKVRADQAAVERANLQLSYTRILAPITGVAGLRKVDPGNMIRAADETGIVVLSQVQPIAVIFTISEDSLPAVLAQVKAGAHLAAEAWDRTFSHKISTGRLAAIDNQIDTQTGTVKLKAEFDNQDKALFPGQFVNVKLFVR